MHFVGCFNFEDPCSMKHPPVVSTLEEWLDGKLGIQGIDAVSCAFYVLSLLQRDETSEPEAFYQFPYSKIVDEQGISYWPQNSWSNWGFDFNENSLTAKCVSAPVQRYEIEHLGNDLSPSLKSVKADGGDCVVQSCPCDRQCFSFPLSDQAQRCHEGVAVLGQPSNKEGKCSVTAVAECKNTLWANESACVGFSNHKLEGGGLEEKNNSSSMAEHLITGKEEFWMADPTENRNPMFLHDENLLWEKKDVGCFFSWNTADHKSSSAIPENIRQKTGSEDRHDVWEPGIFCKQVRSGTTVSMPPAGIKDGTEDMPKNTEEDSNLAQLIAKFDHSIEAIWNLGTADPVTYDITEGQQNLLWDFPYFVSRPQDVLNMDLNNVENNLDSGSEENSFIHSGTNIINSIWSDQPFLSNSAGQADAGVKCVGGGVSNFNNCVNDDHSDDLCCKLKVLLTSDEIIHNGFNLFDWNSGTSNSHAEASKNSSDTYLQEVPEECSDVLWDKIQTFPTLFSNASFQEQFCRMENFQDADCENQQNSNSCMISCSPCSISHFQSSCQDNVQDSADIGKSNFSTLNHNREDSSFTEVLPRHGEKKKYKETNVGNLCSNQLKNADDSAGQTSDENKNNVEVGKEEEEEDLLTSARTHFRPIQHEHQETNNNPACCYADGTTFVISSNFAEVPFQRSESGTLFLESDEVSGTPKKYMEYKDKRSGDQLKYVRISKDNSGNKETFIPKFCVRQVEKCCQTDESDESSDELNSKKFKHGCAERERKSNLFFSEDEIVKNVANYLDDDLCKFSSNEIGCKDNLDDERMDDISAQNAKNDSVSKSLEAEMYIWNKPGCKCNNNYMFSSKSDSLRAVGANFLGEKGFWEPASAAHLCHSRYSIWSSSPGPQTEPCPTCETLTQDKAVQYSQLREELSEDGEQLLSDLSSLQPLQLTAGWLDDALDQGGWGTEPNLLTRVSSRRRLVSWGQFGEG